MGEDKIVASVGGKPITEADVSREIARMGQRGQSYNTPQGRAMVLEQLINKRLFLLDAQRNLYEREPAFKEQLQAIKEEMLTSYAVQKAVERVRVTEEEVKKYYEETGIQIGFKPAGGINSVMDALTYYTIVKEVLGEKWLTNKWFRLGTSRLTNMLLSEILGTETKFF